MSSKKKIKVSLKWTDEQDTFLIERVEQNSFIYDPSSAGYKSRFARQRFYENTAIELNNQFPNLAIDSSDVRNRWLGLLQYYRTTNNKIQKVKKSGAGVEGLDEVKESLEWEPGWKHFQKMSFVRSTLVDAVSVNNRDMSSLEVLNESSNSSLTLGLETEFVSNTCTQDTTPSLDFAASVASISTLSNQENSALTINTPAISLSSEPTPTSSIYRNSKFSRARKTPEDKFYNTCSAYTKTLQEALNNKRTAEREPKCMPFLLDIGHEMDKLGESAQIKLKKRIYDAVFEMRLEHIDLP